MLKYLCCVVLCLFCLVGTVAESANVPTTVRLGWYEGCPFALNKKRVAVLAKYLSSRLNMHVIPVAVRDLIALKKGLKDNNIDFAPVPNYSYPSLLSSVHILATSRYENSRRMYLYIIAGRKSGVTNLDLLKGQPAARVVENNKLKCYFLSESLKARPQEFLGKISQYKNLRDAVNAVADGTVTTTCLSSTAWEVLLRFDPSLSKKIRIIKRSVPYAMDPIVASRKLHESIWWNIQAALIAMSHDYAAQQILMQMGIQGFSSPVVDPSAYPVLLKQPAKPAVILAAGATKQRISKRKQDLHSAKEPVASEAETSPGAEQPSAAASKPAASPVAAPTTHRTVSPDNNPPAFQSRGKGFRKKLAVAAGMIVLALLLGITLLSMLARSRKNKILTVLLVMNKQIIALRSSMNWRGKLNIECCKIGRDKDRQSITELLNAVGHKSAMKLALVLNSDRIILKEYTFPLLTAAEIQPAVDWKLQDTNVPYDKENDFIHYIPLKKDRKKKQLTIMAMIEPGQNDALFEKPELPIKADVTLCVQMALLSRFRKCNPNGADDRVLLAYRLSDQEALILVLQGEHSFVGRRIYAAAQADVHGSNHSIAGDSEQALAMEISEASSSDLLGEADAIALWKPFLPDLEQTINFLSRRSGDSLLAIYLSGRGVPDVPDPDGVLAKQLDVPVAGIDFLSDITVSDGVREGCPAVEILAGAAMIWHERAR